MKRWVGLGVIADNLTHIGTVWQNEKTEFSKSPTINYFDARRTNRRALSSFVEPLGSGAFSAKNLILRRKVARAGLRPGR